MDNQNNPAHPRPGLGRRQFIQASAATAALGSSALVLNGARAGNTPLSLEGYASASSVLQGATLDLYLRDPQAVGNATSPYTISITRTGAPDVFVTSYVVEIGNPAVPATASTQGCGWPSNLRILVPSSWPSGVYYANVGAGENACTVPFIVRPASPTPGVKRLVCIPVATVQAYNEYGGKSLYDFNSSGSVRASQVSMNRPLTQSFNSFFDVWSQYLVRWMAKNGLAADFCTDLDITLNPGLLDSYQLYIQAGHDEYWTLGRRRSMDAFVARGGNAIYMGGNTAWWAIRLESSGGQPNRSIVCYKDAASDPVADPSLKTINFFELPTPYPENITTGLGFRYGCSWASAVPPRPATPIKVMRPEHWAFAGTGLLRDAQFGGEYVGYECDAAQYTLGAADQRAYATGADGSPETLRILGLADASNWDQLSLAAGGSGEQSGAAMIAVFSRGGGAGTVFNTGATDWAYGLAPELNGQTPTPISRITLNAVNKLSAAWSESADVRQFSKAVPGGTVCWYGTEVAAPAASNLLLDGLAFRAFPRAVAGSVPVYRYRANTANTNDSRYRLSLGSSLASTSSDWVLQGVAFHVYAAARTDTLPVYEHMATLSPGVQSLVYGTSATPPAGFNAGPVVFHAPSDGTSAAAAPTPSFLLDTQPAALQITRGRSAPVDIRVKRLNGFNQAVTFSVLGLPQGVTAQFAAASSGTGTRLTLSAAGNASIGSFQLIVRGTSPAADATQAQTVTTVLTLTILPAVQGFSLAPPRHGTVWVLQGQVGCSDLIKVVPQNGFKEAVSFSASGLPAGVTVVFLPPRSTGGSKLVFKVAMAVPAGVYPVTVTGTSASATASTQLTLQVHVSSAKEGFVLLPPANATITLRLGQTATSDMVKVVTSNGFDESVAFAVSGMPFGMVGIFSPWWSKGGAKLIVSPTVFTAPGSYVLTVNGSSTNPFKPCSASTQLTVVVTR